MDTNITTDPTSDLEALADEMIQEMFASIPEIITEARELGLDDLTAIEGIVVGAFKLGHDYGHLCAASQDASVEGYDPPGYL
jgi:hypothetical protein